VDTDGYLRELYRIIDRMRHNLVLSRLPNLSPKVMIALLFIEENFASGVHLSDAAPMWGCTQIRFLGRYIANWRAMIST